MARIARVIASGIPHHVTQRGNRRMETFFHNEDYEEYLSLMAEWCGKCGMTIWAYCLMPNHIHLIAVPETEDALRRGIGKAHRTLQSHDYLPLPRKNGHGAAHGHTLSERTTG